MVYEIKETIIKIRKKVAKMTRIENINKNKKRLAALETARQLIADEMKETASRIAELESYYTDRKVVVLIMEEEVMREDLEERIRAIEEEELGIRIIMNKMR